MFEIAKTWNIPNNVEQPYWKPTRERRGEQREEDSMWTMS